MSGPKLLELLVDVSSTFQYSHPPKLNFLNYFQGVEGFIVEFDRVLFDI